MSIRQFWNDFRKSSSELYKEYITSRVCSCGCTHIHCIARGHDPIGYMYCEDCKHLVHTVDWMNIMSKRLENLLSKLEILDT